MFLGIPDVWVLLGFLLMIFTTIGAVVYGIIMWNRGGETDEDEEEEKRRWMEEELALEEKVDGGVS